MSRSSTSIRRTPRFAGVARRAFGLVVGSVIVASLLPAGVASAGAAKKAKCDAVSGWSAYAGRPAGFVAGGTTGLYVWQENGTWRVGATNDRGARTTFSATVTFDAPVSGKPIGTEGKSDIVDVRAQSVRFRFANFGGVDGVAIDSPCSSSVTVSASVDGQPLTPQQVFLGASGANPGAVPVVLTRGSTAPTTVTSAPTTLTTLPPPSAAPLAATASACPTTAWPVGASGRPSFRKGPAGVYVWIEKGVLRLAFESDPGAPRVYEGKVVANAPLTVKTVGAERRDQIKVAGQQVSFSLRVGAAGDSFDVTAPCASSFSLEVTVDGTPIPASQVYLGATATPSVSMPAVIGRA